MKTWKIVFLFLAAGLLLAGWGCSKNNEQTLAAANPLSCDTTVVTYSGDISGILRSFCFDCHAAANNAGSGGIVLEGYSNLKRWADNGYLLGNVTHASGFVGMPYGRPKLSDCNINKILAWVHRGSPDN
jgi:hypothetical protein